MYDPPKRLKYQDKIDVIETKMHEFKAIQITHNAFAASRDFFRDYMNAFVNTLGGTLWLGIEDNSEVKGIFISENDRNCLQILFEQACSQLVPHVEKDKYRLTFVPVDITIDQFNAQKNQQGTLKESMMENINFNFELISPCKINEQGIIESFTLVNNPDATLQKYVIVAQILKGDAPIYCNYVNTSFIRRDAGIKQLTNEYIIQKLQESNTPPLANISNIQEALNAINAKSYSVINIFGLIGMGKHLYLRYLLEKLNNKPIYIMNSILSFEEQENEIPEKENVVIVWDDPEFVENMHSQIKLDNIARVINKFKKKVCLIILTTTNIANELKKSIRITSIQIKELDIKHVSYIVKQYINIPDDGLEDHTYTSYIARLCYLLGESCHQFCLNCKQRRVPANFIIKTLGHYSNDKRLKFFHNRLYKHLHSFDNKYKQFIGDHYLWDNYYFVTTEYEQAFLKILYYLGLVEKDDKGYKNILVVRKAFQEYADISNIKNQFQKVFSYYYKQLNMAMKTYSMDYLRFVYIDQYDTYLFLIHIIRYMVFNTEQCMFNLGKLLYQNFHHGFQAIENIADQIIIKQFAVIEKIIQDRNETVQSGFVSFDIINKALDTVPQEEWSDLWDRIL